MRPPNIFAALILCVTCSAQATEIPLTVLERLGRAEYSRSGSRATLRLAPTLMRSVHRSITGHLTSVILAALRSNLMAHTLRALELLSSTSLSFGS